MGFEKIVDNLAFKDIDARRNSVEQSLKIIQFFVDSMVY